MSENVTRLRVKDEDFLVASMIERCPKSMMIRELFKNALEAAAGAPAGKRKVEFSAVKIDGVPKLAIWNSGPGLTGPELYRMCDIASSINKEHGLERNFGMGAKVASLPSNQIGMRYRSCRKGTVQEVVIGKFDGIYGRLLRPGPNGALTEVLKVTEAAVAEGRSVDQEWTEVVLFGNSAEQNTVLDPYAGEPRSLYFWLVDAIRTRFFRFPEDIEVVFRKGVAALREDRVLSSRASQFARLSHYEAVSTAQGVTIHYAFNPAAVADEVAPGRDLWGAGNSLCSIVHQDELYSVLRGMSWLKEAPAFGIPFMARAVSIMIELPEDYPVLPDGYREFLRYRSGRQDVVRVMDFSGLVAKHVPEWLTSLLADSLPKADYIEAVRNEMQDRLIALGVAFQRPKSEPNRNEAVPKPPSPPSSGAEPPLKVEVPPAIVPLHDVADIAQRGLTYRAAIYYPETHQLHVNLQYPLLAEVAEELAATAPAGLDLDGVRLAARAAAERAMITRVGRSLVVGLAKRGRRREWAETHVRIVFSPEALTLAAEDVETGRWETERLFAELLKDVPAAKEPPETEAA